MSNADPWLSRHAKSPRLSLILAGIMALGTVALLSHYGTVEPCGMLRESVRQQASREGGFSGFISSVLPDSVLNGIIADRYGALSPTRCVGVLLGLVSPKPTAAPNTASPQTDSTRQRDTGHAQEQTAQEEIATLNALITHMGKFEVQADEFLTKSNNIEPRYRVITSRMEEYLRRERALIGDSNSVARGQIAVSINQGLIASNQLYNELQPLQWSFQNNAVPLKDKVLGAMQMCHRAHPITPDNPVPWGSNEYNAACLRLIDAGQLFLVRFDSVAERLTHLEQVYQQEHQTQQQIADTSFQIQ